MLLRNVKIWDGVSEEISSDYDAILIERGRIKRLTSADEKIATVASRDYQGAFVVPGLIDAHIHLCLDPAVQDPFAHGKVPVETQLEHMVDRAGQMVRAGITSARDLGGGRWLELKIRDRINRGEIQGPRLLCAGQPITSVQGHCHFWGGECSDVASAQTVIDRQIEAGVDLIKIMATGGNITPGSRPVDAQFDEPTMVAIVGKAKAKGFLVAAHCHGVDGIHHAAVAGVSTIEHCSWVGGDGWGANYDEGIAEVIAQKGIWVSPTVNTGWRRHIGNARTEKALKERFTKMRQAGCRLIASTDAGIPNVWHHQLSSAMEVFAVVAGLTNAETLRAATSDCADAVGLKDETGKIIPGLSADLLLCDGDPLLNLATLQQPVEVFSQGITQLG